MISVLIATRDRVRDLEAQLRALSLLQPPEGGWELLVIDNGSADGTGALLGKVAASGSLPLRPFREPHRGKSRALNLGVREARGDLLVFTDDDAKSERGWLCGFARAAREYPECLGFAGPARAVYMGARPVQHHNGIVDYDHGEASFELRPFNTPPPGVNVAFRRTAFERYGLFREDLGPGSPVQRAEDTDFVRRLWMAGERIRYVPDAVVRHAVDPERLTRRFSLRWTFWVGRANARMMGRSGEVPAVKGVPRFIFREVMEDGGHMALSMLMLRGESAFKRAQRLAYNMGLAFEYAGLPRDFDPTRLVPRLERHNESSERPLEPRT